jgi:hypothetical protein
MAGWPGRLLCKVAINRKTALKLMINFLVLLHRPNAKGE